MLIIYKNGIKFQTVGLELVREASDALKWKQIGFRLSLKNLDILKKKKSNALIIQYIIKIINLYCD